MEELIKTLYETNFAPNKKGEIKNKQCFISTHPFPICSTKGFLHDINVNALLLVIVPLFLLIFLFLLSSLSTFLAPLLLLLLFLLHLHEPGDFRQQIFLFSGGEPFFVMDVPHMPLEVAGNAEGSIAFFAFVRLFSGVSSQVSRQVGRSRKMFAAVFARIPISSDDAFHSAADSASAAATADEAAATADRRGSDGAEECGGGGGSGRCRSSLR